ncbi:hypothetical protein FHT87_005197 [Rhizobium sp. BK316]|uniref:hypothetical protein n=1 Tax=Rhizobium sp. BK316 TaxID=2587053 RepID=UPI001609B68A|nr:hypothetical protein [Rhizobium sp. BK316]MBB3411244.1 hypothetical protein [Rhizobium sp. BK316]
MEKIASIVLFSLVLTLVSPILGVAFGALAGWLVGLVFSTEILGFLHRIGVDTEGLTMWQLGAALGFIGGYLKTTVHKKD